MVRAFALLLSLQWVGEVLCRLLDLPLPGPVLGMALLLALLAARGRPVPPALERASSGLLEHLSLLFVPAGVGVVVHLDRLGAAAVPIGVALVVGTPLAIGVTGWVMAFALRRGSAA